MRILVVEDDLSLGAAVRDHLGLQGHAVALARSLAEAENALIEVEPELLLLDLHLPDGQGLDLLRRMRRRGDTRPTIILTARDQISDRIAGLEAGGDDYLVKPFDLDELTARLNALRRRSYGEDMVMLAAGSITIDCTGRHARVDDREVPLTPREWAVIDLMVRKPGALVPRERIEAALAATGLEFESNAVEVYISRIRKKLGPAVIETQRGLGYRVKT